MSKGETVLSRIESLDGEQVWELSRLFGMLHRTGVVDGLSPVTAASSADARLEIIETIVEILDPCGMLVGDGSIEKLRKMWDQS